MRRRGVRLGVVLLLRLGKELLRLLAPLLVALQPALEERGLIGLLPLLGVLLRLGGGHELDQLTRWQRVEEVDGGLAGRAPIEGGGVPLVGGDLPDAVQVDPAPVPVREYDGD